MARRRTMTVCRPAPSPGAVDIIAPGETIPGHLLRLRGEADDTAHSTICAILRRQAGHDFSGYREKTSFRRVSRMPALAFGMANHELVGDKRCEVWRPLVCR